MSIYQYKAGIGNAASYQSSGTPFITGSDSLTGVMLVDFPNVTKEIVVSTTGANDVYVYFNSSATDLNKMRIGNAPTTLTVKCNAVYVSGSAANFRLCASLTGISRKEMFELTGSGITE